MLSQSPDGDKLRPVYVPAAGCSSSVTPPTAAVLTLSVRSVRESKQIVRAAALNPVPDRPRRRTAARRRRADHAAVHVDVADARAPRTTRSMKRWHAAVDAELSP
jgi:hypothetical protein